MTGTTNAFPTLRSLRGLLTACSLVLITACGGDDDLSSLGNDTLAVEWSPTGSTTAFSDLSSSSTSLKLNLTFPSTEHSVQVNANSDEPTLVDLNTQSGTPSIEQSVFPLGESYVISHSTTDREESFDTFKQFIAALSTELKPTSAVLDIAGTGDYESASNTFRAHSLAVLIDD